MTLPDWMRLAAPALGALILLLAYADLFITTLTVDGAGPVTRRLPPLVWAVARLIDRWPARPWVLPYVGMITLLVVAANWIGLLWLGWTLIWLTDDWSVVVSQTGRPADAGGVAYYVGYSLFTLGLGDYRPHGLAWQLLSVVVSGSGLTLVTLIITYIVPVISAAAARRALAARITAFGRTPAGILRRAWTGEDFSTLGRHLQDLAPSLVEQAQQHHVYPILSNFHPLDPDESLVVRLAALDEAVFILRVAAPPGMRPPDGDLDSFRDSMGMLMTVLPGADPVDDGVLPPPPDTSLVIGYGLAAPARDVVDAALTVEEPHRRCLHSILREEGWSWDAVGTDMHPPASHRRRRAHRPGP